MCQESIWGGLACVNEISNLHSIVICWIVCVDALSIHPLPKCNCLDIGCTAILQTLQIWPIPSLEYRIPDSKVGWLCVCLTTKLLDLQIKSRSFSTWLSKSFKKMLVICVVCYNKSSISWHLLRSDRAKEDPNCFKLLFVIEHLGYAFGKMPHWRESHMYCWARCMLEELHSFCSRELVQISANLGVCGEEAYHKWLIDSSRILDVCLNPFRDKVRATRGVVVQGALCCIDDPVICTGSVWAY